MTTVAWDGKTLAADRQTTDGGAVFRLGSKLRKVPGGYIACAGCITDIHKFVAWVQAGMRGKPPTSGEGVDGIMVKSGRLYYIEDSVLIERDRREKIAIGSGWMWAGLCFMGLSATVGHFLLILAYRNTPASTLTPYLYAQIGFAMLGGWLAFGHLPDGPSLFGMALIALCGAAGAWLTVHETRLALRPA